MAHGNAFFRDAITLDNGEEVPVELSVWVGAPDHVDVDDATLNDALASASAKIADEALHYNDTAPSTDAPNPAAAEETPAE